MKIPQGNLEAAGAILGLGPSARSTVPAFIVMDVMEAAAAREAQGHKVIHMEVGQPGTPAPRAALEGRQGHLKAGRPAKAGLSELPGNYPCLPICFCTT